MSYEIHDAHSLRRRVSDMPFQGDQEPHSVGSSEPECIALNQPPRIVIHGVDDAGSPGPDDYNFSCVQTLKFFKTPDSRGDLQRRVENSNHEWVAISNIHLRAVLFPSSVDTISSQEAKFERRRWSRHGSDDANSIRMTAAIMGL